MQLIIYILFWCLLVNFHFSFISVTLGVLASIFTYYFFDKITFKKAYKFCKYFIWLAKEIFMSSLNVMRIIWFGKSNPSKEWVEATKYHVIYANSITLTPGTVTVSIEDDRLLVHSIDKENFIDLKENRGMYNKIKKEFDK